MTILNNLDWKLRSKKVLMVKVLWNQCNKKEVKWEIEVDAQNKWPTYLVGIPPIRS